MMNEKSHGLGMKRTMLMTTWQYILQYEYNIERSKNDIYLIIRQNWAKEAWWMFLFQPKSASIHTI